jgi:hypothetical protein
MSGHQAHRQSHGARPASDYRLDQFAAAVAEARTTNPAVATLATQEGQFIAAALDIGAHLDRQTLGAAWLIAGQLMGTHLQGVPPEHQAAALAMLLNVIKLAGERLYTGNGLPITVACPYTYGNGSACSTARTAPNQDRLDVLMRAHILQNHPGNEWPPPLDTDTMLDAENVAEAAVGLCGECGCEVYLDEDGRIGWHPTGPAASALSCPGSGTKPLGNDTDAETQS